jgi:hypothetical protein
MTRNVFPISFSKKMTVYFLFYLFPYCIGTEPLEDLIVERFVAIENLDFQLLGAHLQEVKPLDIISDLNDQRRISIDLTLQLLLRQRADIHADLAHILEQTRFEKHFRLENQLRRIEEMDFCIEAISQRSHLLPFNQNRHRPSFVFTNQSWSNVFETGLDLSILCDTATLNFERALLRQVTDIVTQYSVSHRAIFGSLRESLARLKQSITDSPISSGDAEIIRLRKELRLNIFRVDRLTCMIDQNRNNL